MLNVPEDVLPYALLTPIQYGSHFSFSIPAACL